MTYLRSRLSSLLVRYCSQVQCLGRRCKILGIETSCDETGCAIVDQDGNILGEALQSHQKIVLQHGGVIPSVAKELHKNCIENVVRDALNSANMAVTDVDAIAATVKPGIALALVIGNDYGKKLAKDFNKPYIPIHHMEAHALTARMIHKDIRFPFLTLLISGGHCILAFVQSVDKFLTLGQSIGDGPGEAFDKAARRLKLRNIPKYRYCSGGAAIEDIMKGGNPEAFKFFPPIAHRKDCNFCFYGLRSVMKSYIIQEEEAHANTMAPDDVIPTAKDLCASYMFAITKHLCWRTQRAVEYLILKEMIPDDCRTLVVSGGVACNSFIRKALAIYCRKMDFRLVVPPPKYCTDNGIMIAWNGVEKYLANIGIYHGGDIDPIDIQPRCPLGEDISEAVANEYIKCDWIRLKELWTEQAEEENSKVAAA